MHMNNAEYWHGVEACKRGEKCPVDASEAFQKGYGTQYAAEQVMPHIDLKTLEKQFSEVFR